MADTFVRDGKAYLRDLGGNMVKVDAVHADYYLGTGDYRPVSGADVARRDEEKKVEAESTLGGAAATFGKAAVGGALDVGLAVTKQPGYVLDAAKQGANALGYELPDAVEGYRKFLMSLSGRKAMEDTAYVAGESQGQEGGVAAREFKEKSRRQREANPLSNLAGNIVGTSLATAGIPAGVAGAAVEGGLAMTAMGSEEAYFGDIEDSAERFVAYFGLGAMLGGGVALGAKGAGAVFRRLGSRGETAFGPVAAGETAGKAGLAGKLRDFSDEQTYRALGGSARAARRMGKGSAEGLDDALGEAMPIVRNYRLKDGTKVFEKINDSRELAIKTEQATAELADKLEAAKVKADEIIAKKPDLAPSTAAIEAEVRTKVMPEIQPAPLPEGAVPGPVAQAQAQNAQAVEGVLGDMKALGPNPSVQKLSQFRRELDDLIYPKSVGNGPPAPAPPAAIHLQKVRNIIEGHVEAAVNKAMEHAGESSGYARLKLEYAALNHAKQLAYSRAGQAVAGTGGGLGQQMAAVAAGIPFSGGGLGTVAAQIGGMAARSSILEHGNSILAVLADKLATAVDGRIDAAVGSFFKGAIKGEAKVPKLVSSVPGRRQPLMYSSLAHFVGKSASPEEAYRKRAKELVDATDNYGAGIRAASARTMADLTGVAPITSGMATAKATNAAEYLKSKLPVGLSDPQSFTPRSSPPPVSRLDISKFARYWSAAANPLSVLHDLNKGTLTGEQVETLQAVYPRLYERIKKSVAQHISELDAKGTPIPLQARMQLSVLLDLDGAGEPAFSSEFAGRFSAIAAQLDQAAQSTPRPSKPFNLRNALGTATDSMEQKHGND